MGLSEERLTDIKIVFKYMDKNGDGKLDVKEIGICLRALGCNPSEKDLKEIVADADKINKDGRIEEEEFIALMEKSDLATKTKEQEEAELKAAFQILDRNGNGYISVDELTYVLTNVGEMKMTKADAKAMIAIADVDKDKQLNYTEFAMEMTKHWNWGKIKPSISQKKK